MAYKTKTKYICLVPHEQNRCLTPYLKVKVKVLVAQSCAYSLQPHGL